MAKLRFYHVSEDYIRFLHGADRRVQHNKDQRRPYVGVVLRVKDFDYFVPLESPKPGHAKIRSGGPVMKLDGGKLGIMGFNNMIPVVDAALIDFRINEVADEKYRLLLYNQLAFCNRHKQQILLRAENTYRRAVEGEIPLYKKVCCDFKKLERVSGEFDPDFRKRKRRPFDK